MASKPLSMADVDFSRRFVRMATAVESGKFRTLRDAGFEAKKGHASVIRTHSGGDMRLSGVGKRGARVGARFDQSADRVEVRATGPLHFVANPMSPHRIPKVRKTSRARRKVVVIPGVGVRANAMHPGTKGKDTWEEGRRQAAPKVERAIQRQWARIIEGAFK